MSGKGQDLSAEQTHGEVQMSFWDHLEVLRWALIRIAIVLVVLVVASFLAMPHIFDTLILGPTTSDFFIYRWFASMGNVIPFFPDGCQYIGHRSADLLGNFCVCAKGFKISQECFLVGLDVLHEKLL